MTMADTDTLPDAPAWARPGGADSDSTTGERSEGLRFAVKDRFASVADEGKDHLLKTFDGLIQAAHEFADRLEQGAGGPVAGYARKAADQLDAWKGHLSDKSVEELVDDGREFVRRQPTIALGSAIAAGFALSRLRKVTR